MSKEFTRNDIVIDRELLVEEDGIHASIETWFDVDEKFGISTEDDPDQTVNFYASYHPEEKALRCVYIVSDGVSDDAEHEYIPTANEAALIVGMMQEVCYKESQRGLLGLWRELSKAYDGQTPEIKFAGAMRITERGIDAFAPPWFDEEEQLPFPIPQDTDTGDVFFYALYNPGDGSMKYICHVEYDDAGIPERKHEYTLSDGEIALLKDGMEALCQAESGCSLEDYWKTGQPG